MRWEPFVEIGQTDDATFSRFRADSQLNGIKIFDSIIVYFGGGEIVVTERFWSNDHHMRDICLWCDAIDDSAQFSSDNIECVWVETIVDYWSK